MTVPLNKHETLFSFEFLVEYVRLDFDCKLLNSWKPAVGVRLLDFPTLVIYQTDGQLFTSKSDVDKSNGVVFQKGKSCLFKINLDFLQKHLSNTPLYAMVMDVGHTTPKLIGSSLISLARLVNQIKSDVEAHGIGTPSACGERGVYDLCNLMGRKIGLVSIACKLVSLGGSLISHIPENRIHSVGTTLSQRSNRTETAKMPAEVVCDITGTTGVLPLEQEDSRHVICQRVPFDGHLQDIVVSEAEQTTVASTGTQTEQTGKRIKKIEIARIDYEDEPSSTMFCPPPMFYSSSDKIQKDNEGKNFKPTNSGMDSLRVADLYTDDEGLDSEMPFSNEQRGPAVVEHPTGSQIQPQPLVPANLGDTIRQLPLLNALLVELSLLNGQNQQQPLSIHPSLAWIYTPAQGPSDHAVHGARPAPQTLKNNASPQQKAQQSSSTRQDSECGVKSLITISPSNKQRRKKADKHSPHPDEAKPNRKLTYGLTHTYRLRLQRLSTDLPKPRECMEHVSVKQCMEHVNLKQPKPTKRKKKNRSTNSHTLKSSLRLDDNIETLVSSINVDSTQESTPPKSTDRPNICVLSNDSNDVPNHEAASILKNTPKNKPVRFKQNKELHIRIPSALSQHSGPNGLESSHRHSSHPEHKANDPAFSSNSEDEGGQGESRWSGPPSKFSDPSSESMDQVDYQDDFTSLDTTDGYSQDLLSSPEPRLPRAPSDPSSLNDESVRKTSLPVPVKAATSPKRSFKGTHLIRQSTQASRLTISSDGDDVRSGYSPSVQSRHSQMRSGSQNSELGNKVSVSRDPTWSRSERGEPTDDVTHYRGYSEDSFDHENDSDPESTSLLNPVGAEEVNDELGTLGLTKKYQHITDLMVNKLPGYTL